MMTNKEVRRLLTARPAQSEKFAQYVPSAPWRGKVWPNCPECGKADEEPQMLAASLVVAACGHDSSKPL
jgi:hypothetical protein